MLTQKNALLQRSSLAPAQPGASLLSRPPSLPPAPFSRDALGAKPRRLGSALPGPRSRPNWAAPPVCGLPPVPARPALAARTAGLQRPPLRAPALPRGPSGGGFRSPRPGRASLLPPSRSGRLRVCAPSWGATAPLPSPTPPLPTRPLRSPPRPVPSQRRAEPLAALPNLRSSAPPLAHPRSVASVQLQRRLRLRASRPPQVEPSSYSHSGASRPAWPRPLCCAPGVNLPQPGGRR